MIGNDDEGSFIHNNIELNEEEEQRKLLKQRLEEIEIEEKQKEAERIKKATTISSRIY